MPNNESASNTLWVACVLCVVCSIVVSSSAVFLKERQLANQVLDKQRNILVAAGLMAEGESTDRTHLKELFENIDIKYVDLDNGEYVLTEAGYDALKASKEADQSRALSTAEDLAKIKRRENIGPVYLTRDGQGEVSRIILPVRGYGLWSTLYGFLALETDAKTVAALSFYQHAETPGLGGEVDNPIWKAHWAGKVMLNDLGEPQIDLYKGKVTPEVPGHQYKFDSLAGATLTSQGVENLLNFWVSELGYGLYLEKLRVAGV